VPTSILHEVVDKDITKSKFDINSFAESIFGDKQPRFFHCFQKVFSKSEKLFPPECIKTGNWLVSINFAPVLQSRLTGKNRTSKVAGQLVGRIQQNHRIPQSRATRAAM
jgi:hypothetical protein